MSEPTLPPPRTSPSATRAALQIFDLSLSEMLWSRRTIFMALVVGLPVVVAALIRVLVTLGAPLDRTLAGPAIFGLMIWAFYVHFSVPVLATFYGTALIADEVEDKTITYLFTRPIPRGAVLIGKYLAYLACTIFVVLPSVVLVWLIIVPIRGSLGGSFPDLLVDLGQDLRPAAGQAADADVAEDDDVVMLPVELEQVGLLRPRPLVPQPQVVDPEARVGAEGVHDSLRLWVAGPVRDQDADALLGDGDVGPDFVVGRRDLARQRVGASAPLRAAVPARGS